MTQIVKSSINFVINGEPLSASVLNRALNQTIDQINAAGGVGGGGGGGGGDYTAGDGLSLSGSQFSVNNTVTRTTGNFTINGTWQFNSTLTATGFTVNSDARLKECVKDYPPVKDKTLIKLKKWIWADSKHVPEDLRGTMDSGVIADDVEEVFPTCVYVNEYGIKRVDYAKLAVHLILSEGE